MDDSSLPVDPFEEAADLPRRPLLRGLFVEGSSSSFAGRPGRARVTQVERLPAVGADPEAYQRDIAAFIAAFDESRRRLKGEGVPFLAVALRIDDEDAAAGLPPLSSLLRSVIGSDVPMASTRRGRRLVALLPGASAVLGPELLRRLRQRVLEAPDADARRALLAIHTLVLPHGEPFTDGRSLLRHVLGAH